MCKSIRVTAASEEASDMLCLHQPVKRVTGQRKRQRGEKGKRRREGLNEKTMRYQSLWNSFWRTWHLHSGHPRSSQNAARNRDRGNTQNVFQTQRKKTCVREDASPFMILELTHGKEDRGPSPVRLN